MVSGDIENLGKPGKPVFRRIVAVIVVSSGQYIRIDSIKTRKSLRYRRPLQGTWLVTASSTLINLPSANKVVILLHQVAGAKHGFYIQGLSMRGNPCCQVFKKRLVEVELDVGLRVSQQN